ncbi:hypothetical protein C8Q76DRAFT_789189 [Earliella scabrosa]|nr:hypothetical protein C8Q76DRAFT_789189 [Earliella scabrosa]
MAPPTDTATSQSGPLLTGDAKLTQSVNPLDANFNGPVTTVPNADGTGSLLLDPTGTSLAKPTDSASSRVAADGSSTRSIPSPSPPPNSPTSAPSSNEPSTGRVTHQVLVGVAAVLAVVILAALGLLFYLYWKRRRRTASPQYGDKHHGSRPRKVVSVMDRDMGDPFAGAHIPRSQRHSRPLPAIPSEEKRGTKDTLKIIHCATDAGSVYVLDGESIYGDNGASVKGILPPAYDDLPSSTSRSTPTMRELPPLPLRLGTSAASARTDISRDADVEGGNG